MANKSLFQNVSCYVKKCCDRPFAHRGQYTIIGKSEIELHNLVCLLVMMAVYATNLSAADGI